MIDLHNDTALLIEDTLSCQYITLTGGFYYFVLSININEGRLNNKNTSRYKVVQLNSTTIYSLQLNQHLHVSLKHFLTKTDYYNLHEGGIYKFYELCVLHLHSKQH